MRPEFNFSDSKSGRPSAARIIAAWKKAGKPLSFSVSYGETEAEFTFVNGCWDDSGNGCRGVDRNAVVIALNTETAKAINDVLSDIGMGRFSL